MTIYEQCLAERDASHANIRMDRMWRLGGFVLNVRDASHEPVDVGSHSRIHYLPEVDPVTRTATGRPRICREIA